MSGPSGIVAVTIMHCRTINTTKKCVTSWIFSNAPLHALISGRGNGVITAMGSGLEL